jgi:hypothetical protein
MAALTVSNAKLVVVHIRRDLPSCTELGHVALSCRRWVERMDFAIVRCGCHGPVELRETSDTDQIHHAARFPDKILANMPTVGTTVLFHGTVELRLARWQSLQVVQATCNLFGNNYVQR